MNINDLSPIELAAIMHRSYFDDTAAAMTTYLACSSTDPSAPIRDQLIAALDADIADLLHNANLSDLLPFADRLPDDEYETLSTRLLDNDDYIAPLADFILIDYTNE